MLVVIAVLLLVTMGLTSMIVTLINAFLMAQQAHQAPGKCVHTYIRWPEGTSMCRASATQ